MIKYRPARARLDLYYVETRLQFRAVFPQPAHSSEAQPLLLSGVNGLTRLSEVAACALLYFNEYNKSLVTPGKALQQPAVRCSAIISISPPRQR